MKRKASLGLGACAALLMAAGALSPAAHAETVDFGQPTDIDVVDIEIEQHWTVSDLQPSADALPYQPAGALWEATTAVTLDHGGVPMISGFSARSAADSYPVLWAVASPLGIPPTALPPDGTASGKIYFDVTGAAPTSVVYTLEGADAAAWGQSPPA